MKNAESSRQQMLEALEVALEVLKSIDADVLSRSDRKEIERAEAYIEDALRAAKGDA